MNILHMKYAVEVARAGTLSKASETLLIAQPNISRSIKELEADLGITIFERTSKGMMMTPEGEVFINGSKVENLPFEELILNPGLAKDPILLGEEEYFVMGDNCNISEDSRFVNIGVVLKEDIIGQVVRIINPKDRRAKLT